MEIEQSGNINNDYGQRLSTSSPLPSLSTLIKRFYRMYLFTHARRSKMGEKLFLFFLCYPGEVLQSGLPGSFW